MVTRFAAFRYHVLTACFLTCFAAFSTTAGAALGQSSDDRTNLVVDDSKSPEPLRNVSSNPWRPIRISLDTAFEVVRFGQQTDFLILGVKPTVRNNGGGC